LGLFGSGTYWVFISIHQYGNTDIPLALLLTALFILFTGIFTLMPMALYRFLFRAPTTYALLMGFPACWVAGEWLRSILFTGFPWLLLGYAHTDSLFSHLLPLIGVYGVSFISVLLA